MTIGLLWWCTKPDLKDNIQAAMERYEQKYGRKPELCLVNPKMLDGKTLSIDGLTVRPYRPVLPGHIWIGFEDMPTEPKEVTPL